MEFIQEYIFDELPPNYAEVKAKFPVVNKFTIFSFGRVVYMNRAAIVGKRMPPKQIIIHEAVHGERQIQYGVENWWRKYLDDASFRFDEELVAHRAEFKAFKVGVPMPSSGETRRMWSTIAARLSGPLYGNIISFERAKEMIR